MVFLYTILDTVGAEGLESVGGTWRLPASWPAMRALHNWSVKTSEEPESRAPSVRSGTVLVGTVLVRTLMPTSKRNPFDYGGPVTGQHFAGRRDELAAVTNRLNDHIGVVVTAPRRYGKSSLIKEACTNLSKSTPSTAVVSVNLLQTGSLAAISGALLKNLYQVPGGPWHRLAQVLPGFLKRVRLQPSITFDSSGQPTFTFSPSMTLDNASQIVSDVYQVLDKIGEKNPAVLVFDEFQAVADLSPHLPGLLKGLADEHRRVSLVLAGSKHHLMESLVLSKGAPLYNMLEHIALGPMAKDDWLPFLLERARGGGRPFASDEVAELLWRSSGPVPFDIQKLAYESFGQADASITRAVVTRSVEVLVKHQIPDFAKTFEKLSPGQRRVLKLLAARLAASVGSSDFATAAGLADASSVRKAMRALEDAELVVNREHGPAVDDPFFASWLLRPDGDYD